MWGNPPDEKTLGMLIPTDISPMSRDSWGVVITYQSDGHVSDDDAEKIDYNELLDTMRKGVADENESRVKRGFPSIEIMGWATPPRYDRATKKLYWAKDLKFGSDAHRTLNYNVRVLGKDGVLVLNAVANLDQLPSIETEMQKVIGFVELEDGHRYDQFDPRTDKVAAYGIAALVAGGVATKAGLFKGLLLALVAAKKAVIAGVAAIAAAVAKLFKRKESE
jgi:uncharacterized membrane-anchored protein